MCSDSFGVLGMNDCIAEEEVEEEGEGLQRFSPSPAPLTTATLSWKEV